MQAGFARVEITPPVDEHPEMMGFGAFLGRTALEIAQPLHVRASYLEGEEAALLLSFDSCGLREDLADEVRAAAGKAVGLAPAQVITACTHTHSAPSVMPIIGWGEFHAPTAERLPRQAAQAARAARKSAGPVTVSAGMTELENFNRNRVYGPGGPRDTRLRVLAFHDEAGALRGAWAHYTCHPVWLCEKCRVISPDFCGVAMQALEAERPGFVGTFLQGFCGDINPVRAHFPQERSLVHLAHAGYRFRSAVGDALAQAKPVRGEKVRAASARLPLPVAVLSEATLNAFVASAQDRGEGWRRLVQIARPQMEAEAKRLAKQASREVPISALRVANHTLTFHPFEMFTALGLEIEANIGGSAWTVGYANSYEGYAPTVDRFAPQSGDYAAHAVPLMMGRHPYTSALGEELVEGLSGLGKMVGR